MENERKARSPFANISENIPGIGNVVCRPVTEAMRWGAFTACKHKPKPADCFVQQIIVRSVLAPAITIDDVSALPESSKVQLYKVIAEASGIQMSSSEQDTSESIANELWVANERQIAKLRKVLQSSKLQASVYQQRWLRNLQQGVNKALMASGSHHRAIVQSAARLSAFPLSTMRRLSAIALRHYSSVCSGSINVLQQLAEQQFRQMRSLARSPLVEIPTLLLKRMRPLPLMPQWMQDFLQLWEKRQREIKRQEGEVLPYFENIGFGIPLSMPTAVVTWAYRLHQECQAGHLTENEVARLLLDILLETYRLNDFEELRDMVSRWFDQPEFAKRKHILEDALDAHIRGQYTLTVPVLFTQIEGIAKHITNVKPTKKNAFGRAIKKLKSRTDAEFNRSPELVLWWKLAEGAFRKNKTYLPRHDIIHGINVTYATEANSLRLFLLLDVLFYFSVYSPRGRSST